MEHDHKRGTVRANALAALVTSPTYRARAERNQKGKGSYRRKAKHPGRGYSSVRAAA